MMIMYAINTVPIHRSHARACDAGEYKCAFVDYHGAMDSAIMERGTVEIVYTLNGGLIRPYEYEPVVCIIA